MPDMLVKLYELPAAEPMLGKLREGGIDVRRALAPEMHTVVEWVRRTFGMGWGSECQVSFANQPISCFIATEEGKPVGFGCYDATCKDFFGPTGVAEEKRKKGIGKALLLACLHAMRAEGYGYAIIGGAGPVDFYAKAAGAVAIEGSQPGIYRGMLRGEERAE
jgi:GNAT superfamily N-acetyltransferase